MELYNWYVVIMHIRIKNGGGGGRGGVGVVVSYFFSLISIIMYVIAYRRNWVMSAIFPMLKWNYLMMESQMIQPLDRILEPKFDQ